MYSNIDSRAKQGDNMNLYDVCSDLSLSFTEDKVSRGYKWIKQDMFIQGQVIIVELGYCLKYKELHYLRTSSEVNIEGERLQ
jgi:hypothetical protein